MCNLYSVTTSIEAIRQIILSFDLHESVGNFPPMPWVAPNSLGPVVRMVEGRPELAKIRWGMPSPPQVLAGKETDPGVTNVRNVDSPHWRNWLNNRCVVPWTSFSEYDTLPDGKKEVAWFAFDESRL